MAAEKFIIEIRTKGFKGANKSLERVTKSTRAFSREANRGSGVASTFRRSMSGLRNNLLLVSFAFGTVALAFKKFIDAFKRIMSVRNFLSKNNYKGALVFSTDGLGFFEKTKTLLCFMSCFMIILMPTVSLNFLPGNVDLGYLDALAAAIFLLGVGYEIKALNELKKLSLTINEKLHRKGLWFLSRHPDLLGQLVSWWGLYLLALGAYGGEWSIFGPLVTTFLYFKFFLIDLEIKLTRKYNEYNEYRLLTPAIFPKVPFLKS